LKRQKSCYEESLLDEIQSRREKTFRKKE